MYDLYVPNERYEAEMLKLKMAIDGIDENKELVRFIQNLLYKGFSISIFQ